MKRIIAFFLVLFFVSVKFVSAIDFTLGFGWRMSDKGFVLGEQPIPLFSQYEDEYGKSRYFQKMDNILTEKVSSFQRKGYLILGMDFSIYKGLSLGFEASAGFIERKFEQIYVFEIYGEGIVAYKEGKPVYNHYKDDRKTAQATTIVPINFFLALKYRFQSIKKATGFLRPYIGIGAGLNATLFTGDGVMRLENIGSYKYLEGEGFVHSEAIVAMIGVDLFFLKRVGIFIEGKYIKPLKDKANFRKQIVLVTGFRFI